jgi:hypothetical protein
MATKEWDPDDYARSLTGYAYPMMEDVPHNVRSFRRRWTLRVAKKLPDVSFLNGWSTHVEATMHQEVERTYAEVLHQVDLPVVSAVRIDDHHLVLEIECPKPGIAVGDVAAIGTWVALRAVDKEWTVEDLEGIPRRYWFSFGA